MRTRSDSELRAIWDPGMARHPIDQALLLGARAWADLAPDALPDQPLGARNAAC